jgi:iron complex transport system permease protein
MNSAGLRQRFGLLIALAVVWLISFMLSLSMGSQWVSPWEVGHALYHADGVTAHIVTELRLPRTLAAMATGGLLALAGALMQVLLRNPLADPYVLGVSGGASVLALLGMLLGIGGIGLTGMAFVGAMGAMLLVFGLARGAGSWTPTRLLLTGIVLASGWGAVITFILAVSPQPALRGMLFWLIGDLSYSRYPLWGLGLLAVGLVAGLVFSRDLNVMQRGSLTAGALGVNVARLRIITYVIASLLTAGAVILAGGVGFVGLVVPHLIRLLGVTDYRRLLPAAVLLGASLLLLADALARSALAPQQLPVGVLTAALGVPLFLFLLHRGRWARQ